MDVNLKWRNRGLHKAHRRLLEINYWLLKTNRYVNGIILKLEGKPLLSTIKRRKMWYYGHIWQVEGSRIIDRLKRVEN